MGIRSFKTVPATSPGGSTRVLRCHRLPADGDGRRQKRFGRAVAAGLPSTPRGLVCLRRANRSITSPRLSPRAAPWYAPATVGLLAIRIAIGAEWHQESLLQPVP